MESIQQYFPHLGHSVHEKKAKVLTCPGVSSIGYSRRRDGEPDSEISTKSGGTANLIPSQTK